MAIGVRPTRGRNAGSSDAARPVVAALPPLPDDTQPPYVRIAAALRLVINTGTLGETSALPGVKQIAARYDVSVGTAHRALALLREEARIDVVPGRGYCVIAAPAALADVAASGDTVASTRGPTRVPVMSTLSSATAARSSRVSRRRPTPPLRTTSSMS